MSNPTEAEMRMRSDADVTAHALMKIVRSRLGDPWDLSFGHREDCAAALQNDMAVCVFDSMIRYQSAANPPDLPLAHQSNDYFQWDRRDLEANRFGDCSPSGVTYTVTKLPLQSADNPPEEE